jgi:chemotaxis protein MotA
MIIVDKGTVAGIVVSFGGITAGLLLEGGKLSQILQPTAALIVAGGTVGAVLLQYPLGTVITAVRGLRTVLFEPRSRASDEISRLTKLAQKARRDGIISLDAELPNIADPFMRRALMLAVDGTESSELRAIMQLELDATAEAEDELPRVFESAGGFAPTIGIIGAVLGLIQVMQHLDKIDEVGRGIAVAFVATIYGVGFANLFALPIAGKLRHRLRFRQILRELTLEGVISILEGINPRMLEAKLNGFLQQAADKSAPTTQPRTDARAKARASVPSRGAS